MATPRGGGRPVGTRIRGERPAEPSRPGPPPDPEPVRHPARPRDVVDYALARRAAVESLKRGTAFREDLCDADPYLVRAARHHGETTERACPACSRGRLVHVTYVFGDELGPYSGRIRASDELPAMALEHGMFRVYVVEVCRDCRWNHLHLAYTLGDGTPRLPMRRSRDQLD